MRAEQQVRATATAQTPSTPPAPRYRFRDGIWEVICREKEWPNTLAASKALGVSDTTISRGLEGIPGERLMAAVMAALPRAWKFEHVFELVTDDVPRLPIATAGSAAFTVVSSVTIVLLLLLLAAVTGFGAA